MTESVLLDTSIPPTLPPSSHLLTPRPRPQGRFDWEASGFDCPPLLSYGPSPPALCPQGRFDWEASGFDRPPLLSYGPCQFPTLGLIVQV